MAEVRVLPDLVVLDPPYLYQPHGCSSENTKPDMCVSKANLPAEEAERRHLSRRLHSLPEAEIQDDDDDHQTEQQLPLGQADVMDPTALVQVKDTAPVSRKEDSVREDDQVPRNRHSPKL